MFVGWNPEVAQLITINQILMFSPKIPFPHDPTINMWKKDHSYKGLQLTHFFFLNQVD